MKTKSNDEIPEIIPSWEWTPLVWIYIAAGLVVTVGPILALGIGEYDRNFRSHPSGKTLQRSTIHPVIHSQWQQGGTLMLGNITVTYPTIREYLPARYTRSIECV